MRQGRGGTRNKKCCNRRVAAAPITLPGATLEDSAPASWKGPGPDQTFATNSGPNYSGPQAAYQGQSPCPGPPVGAGSPAGGPYSGPPTGSSTPQYTASPAPSGSSTPGPGPQQFPPTSNSAGPTTFNGPSPYGSPSSGGPPFGRPNSSGPPFVGGNPHFASGQSFGAPQFSMPPGSPFAHGPPPIGGPIPGHGMMSSAPNSIDRIDPPPGCFPVHRRNTPYCNNNTPEYRFYELNKKLQQRAEECDNLWWDSLVTEFFEEDATLTLCFTLDDGAKRYTIGRTLIPRYFRSIFDGGVHELYYNLKHPKESFHNTIITLDCDQCTMVTHHGTKPCITKVCAEGRLTLEFTYDDLMRIKTWHFTIRGHHEFVLRELLGNYGAPGSDPSMLEKISKNITRQGITSSTINYLRLCVILEPMQELMSRHKTFQINPRDCLKTTLFQKWQRMIAPPEPRPTNKRRKRKGSQSNAATNNTPTAPTKKRSPGPTFALASQDVMVVGEPSLMGGEFGDEDERLITRLENTQYDASANSLDHDPGHSFSDSPLTGPGPGGPGPPGGPNAGPNSWVTGPPSATPSAAGPDNDKKSPAVSQ